MNTIHTVKIRKIGSSHGVIFSKELLEKMNIVEGQELNVANIRDGEITLTAYDPRFNVQMQAAESIMNRYRNALKELADK
jgi:putative addiction module antidote